RSPTVREVNLGIGPLLTRGLLTLDRKLRTLEMILEVSQKSLGIRAIDDAMIETQCEVNHVTNRHVVFAVRSRQHLCALLDLAYTKNCNLRLIDDRCAKQSTEDAGVGDRESAAGNFVRFQLFGACPIR